MRTSRGVEGQSSWLCRDFGHSEDKKRVALLSDAADAESWSPLDSIPPAVRRLQKRSLVATFISNCLQGRRYWLVAQFCVGRWQCFGKVAVIARVRARGNFAFLRSRPRSPGASHKLPA